MLKSISQASTDQNEEKPVLKLPAGLEPISRHFAHLILELAESQDPFLLLGALAASEATQAQNACANLRLLAEQPIQNEEALCYPALAPWLASLRKHSQVVGLPGESCPLILETERLYLNRYWQYEHQLAQQLRQRSQNTLPLKTEHLQNLIAQFKNLFPPSEQPDWQALAAANALLNTLSIIAGGPGTGKTTTVAKLLALLLENAPDLRITLAAPTGKAAARMKQALLKSLESGPFSAQIRSRMPESALTLHRLLGYRPGSHLFKHGPENPLPWDVIIVDEASMIDLALMSKLVQAVRPDARLILLGDPDQLASVEAGCVLGDICRAAQADAFSAQRRKDLEKLSGQILLLPESQNALDDQVIQLKHSHRFGPQSGIGHLARAINAGQAEHARHLLQAPEFKDICLEDLPAQIESLLGSRIKQGGWARYLSADSPQAALEALEDQVLLCALRRGPTGVEGLNRAMEKALQHSGLLSLNSPWYHLRPVLISENDYLHGLFNGDMGITWNPEGHSPRIYFFTEGQTLHSFSPAQLGAHETAWALTVHKSQGSEFHEIMLILPPEETPLLSRELLYTGITRARQRVEIWGSEAIFRSAVQHRIERSSGLVVALSIE
ncbi:exodeoxyribonuclease V subunit alpha [bacterium (Candidatus Blackallbacteria) CG17_big_fil_post_rev_8_21_14_2_50_48_46]|uniref:Exodeoxyribonuclease V subunit alpha n=1 Tax=bacterium (Candidatus Blackallbacteria) CG17_big_fil_post_rev_8_21_14_2_50_48_46 TaxID=2014261 RepID=A0A2M7FYT2_9BACT|nr:MAG: exodeoxyribonuclease V subunit alpha [bacterium (Candidatus Blackallbacteria) CG18_big_fil_WC_8_21_14_2_50_49_26]PIW14226.1 MAG: exodeoxyribonuclease V subunit alpha [bacterium (Candidatus Blackallbacteria) CG17_big_fil_post_rev_8_21_14_2_50_48_46]PIW46969.1 MAG: exodeoxyribonuclease V subunit alpha [bacterium (Candidatus Blackallbacteria) CG13_big_fil_rev_8_21_14_2_50_49_14]